MSKLIPPLVSTTPPPIGVADADVEDDEFGDFAATDDTTYGCDSFSIPNTPDCSPRKTPNILTNATNEAQDIPEIIPNEAETKDHHDKRKNVANLKNSHEPPCSASDTDVPNVPMHSVDNLITNGHNCNDNETMATSVGANNESRDDAAKEDDDAEHPPQLFDDDSEEKEEISDTPSNFSISFDDNVICDDDDEEEESDNMPIQLPNHVNDVEVKEAREIEECVPKMAETCKNSKIQEFDDFDDEWKQADGAEAEKSEEIVEESDKFEDCEENVDNSETTEDVGKEDDDFGDFNAFASIPTPQSEVTVENVTCDIQTNAKYSDSFSQSIAGQSLDAKKDGAEDFDDFQFTDVCTKPSQDEAITEAVVDKVTSAVTVDDADDFDDFADFSSAPIDFPVHTPQNVEASQLNVRSVSLEQDGGDDEDDFGDFDDYTTSTNASATLSTAKPVPLLNPDKVYEETQVIFKVMFEPIVSEARDYEYSDATVQNAIFGQIKDVTDAYALRYQWAKSQVQQGLLKALNIDSRNILYAHGMTMPKFAANLGMTPLEPVKSDVFASTQLTPSSDSSSPHGPSSGQLSQHCHVQQTQQNGDIPAAQFDWNASGLANPLDSNQTSTLFDLEQLAASLSLPTSTTCAVGVDSNHASEKSTLDDDWDLWLQSVSKEESKPTLRNSQTSVDSKFEDTSAPPKPPTYDTESVNSLQFPEMADIEEPKPENVENADDFSDFTSFQSPPTSWSTSNMIPLRETYIDDVKSDWGETGLKSNSHSRKSSYEPVEKAESLQSVVDDVKEEPSWLKSTILTPVLSHKEISVPTVEHVQAGGDEDDEFADFQDFQTSSAPVTNNRVVTITTPKVAEVKTPEVQKSEVMTAFGGSLLNPTVLQPTLLEPVKLNASMEPQAILWPDPGITDEELARFDLYAKKDGNNTPTISSILSMAVPNDPCISSVFKAPETKLSGPGGSLMVEKHVVVPANKVILPFNEVLLPPNNQVVISKDLVLPILESSPRKYPQQKTHPPPLSQQQDDDDWSDFISTQPTTGPSTGISGSNSSPSKHTLSSSTSTPELSLSIPQLRSMQSMQTRSKPPVPVITPRGLVQTKIPTMAPSTPVKSLPQTALHVGPPGDGYQPAIISTQFAAQLNRNSNANQTPFSDFLQNGHYQTTSIPTNGQLKSPQKKPNGLHDDDEWSDFMSSQPVKTVNHSLHMPTWGGPNAQQTQSMQTLQSGNLAPSTHYNQPNLFGGGASAHSRTDWNRNGYPSDLPNIITNPVHFQSYPTMDTPANVLSRKSAMTNGVLHSKNKKPQNLNVSRLPDLDFVAPKTKVFHNSKK